MVILMPLIPDFSSNGIFLAFQMSALRFGLVVTCLLATERAELMLKTLAWSSPILNTNQTKEVLQTNRPPVYISFSIPRSLQTPTV